MSAGIHSGAVLKAGLPVAEVFGFAYCRISPGKRQYALFCGPGACRICDKSAAGNSGLKYFRSVSRAVLDCLPQRIGIAFPSLRSAKYERSLGLASGDGHAMRGCQWTWARRGIQSGYMAVFEPARVLSPGIAALPGRCGALMRFCAGATTFSSAAFAWRSLSSPNDVYRIRYGAVGYAGAGSRGAGKPRWSAWSVITDPSPIRQV